MGMAGTMPDFVHGLNLFLGAFAVGICALAFAKPSSVSEKIKGFSKAAMISSSPPWFRAFRPFGWVAPSA
jgi:hypothetical protein